MLNTPFYLSLPTRSQEGTHSFNTIAFQKFFDLGIMFHVPNDDNEKFIGTCKIDKQLYHYSATGMRAKGSGAGIWTVQLTNRKNNATTEFTIKCNPTKNTGLDNFDQITRQKDMTEILMMDLMSGNNHALQFHGAYSTPNGTLVFGMEKAKSNMLTVLALRQQEAAKGRLNTEAADQYLLNMAQGLQSLHRCGQVHGDVKSDNFMLGSNNVPRIADFGESYVDISNQKQALKNDIHSFATMAYNMRYGSNKTTDNLAAAIKTQQAKLKTSFNAKVATIIGNLSELKEQTKINGDMDTYNYLNYQLISCKDPKTKLDAVIDIAGNSIDESVRSYAINTLLLEAIETSDPDFDYMNQFTRKLSKWVRNQA